jgi:hypothetical protein
LNLRHSVPLRLVLVAASAPLTLHVVITTTLVAIRNITPRISMPRKTKPHLTLACGLQVEVISRLWVTSHIMILASDGNAAAKAMVPTRNNASKEF